MSKINEKQSLSATEKNGRECEEGSCSAWFILYDGSSSDGQGYPRYCGRTTNPKKALNHFKKCKSNPYSTGRVLIFTDTEERIAHNEQSFATFTMPNRGMDRASKEESKEKEPPESPQHPFLEMSCSALWRDDGERFSRNEDGTYSMDNSMMASKYRYSFGRLMDTGAFSVYPPTK